MIKGAVQNLDKWLWHRGMHQADIRAVVRVQIMFTGVLFAAGVGLAPFSLWVLWFAVGAGVMTLIFYGITQYFVRHDIRQYSYALLFGALLRTTMRLLLTAGILYVALVLCAAPVAALLCGFSTASAVALGTYALTRV